MASRKELIDFFEQLKQEGISPEHEEMIKREIYSPLDHGMGFDNGLIGPFTGFYDVNDFYFFHSLDFGATPYLAKRTLDELLDRDEQREKDGFPKKIRIGKLVRQGKGRRRKAVVVPSTTEDKFIHDNRVDELAGEEGASGGVGEGEEGDVIGEEPLQGEGDAPGAGSGSGDHEINENSYNLGRVLTEKFQLPNLKDKGKKKVCTKYTYDLTDRFRGRGQFLDKRETFKRIVQTNAAIGIIKPPGLDDYDDDNSSKEEESSRKNPKPLIDDPSKLIIDPQDLVYRVLSREKDYESQAVVFLARDYSWSMYGKPAEVVITKDIFIHAWLTYQYKRLVIPRFAAHDTEAIEVFSFEEYANLQAGGGTQVASVFALINKIVREENLAQEYNIYVFYGTDGEDFSEDGKETIAEIEEMMTYVNRLGITVVQNRWYRPDTGVEKYINSSGLLDNHPELIRMDVMSEDADEDRIIEGIKTLVSED